MNLLSFHDFLIWKRAILVTFAPTFNPFSITVYIHSSLTYTIQTQTHTFTETQTHTHSNNNQTYTQTITYTRILTHPNTYHTHKHTLHTTLCFKTALLSLREIVGKMQEKICIFLYGKHSFKFTHHLHTHTFYFTNNCF